MTNSSGDASTVLLINSISSELNRYLTLFVFLLGTVGHLLNIIILSESTLRQSPCVLYFLGSSVSNLGILLIGLPTRLIAGWISTDPTNTNASLCKIRIFLLYSFRSIAVWLIVVATIDRWLVSSTQIARRQLSSNKIAIKVIIITHILSYLLWAQSLYCYDTNVVQAPLRCYGMSIVCRVLNDLTYASTAVIIPSTFMLIFGFLTIQNIIHSRQVIEPFIAFVIRSDSMVRKKRKTRRNEGSLTRMLLLQVIVVTLFSLPQAIHQFYLTFTVNIIRTPLRSAIENFIVNFNFSLTYVGNASPFYIYTLTGTVFRQTSIRLVRRIYRKFKIYSYYFIQDIMNYICR